MSFSFFLPPFSFVTFFFLQGIGNSGVISLPVNRILFEVSQHRESNVITTVVIISSYSCEIGQSILLIVNLTFVI